MHDCDWVLITKMKCSVTVFCPLNLDPIKLLTDNTVICGSFSKKTVMTYFFKPGVTLKLYCSQPVRIK